MASRREHALAALHDRLATIAGAAVLRNAVLPESVPAGGLVILRDGDPGEPELVFSPLAYHYRHAAEIEAFVQAGAAGDRDAAMDALLGAIGNAIAADRTLGGAVEHVEASAPDLSDEAVAGAPAVKQATVMAFLHYTTSDPLA